jgi:hypothetical protein
MLAALHLEIWVLDYLRSFDATAGAAPEGANRDRLQRVVTRLIPVGSP